jgi:N-acetylglucosamine-6-phosphate deacetylase
MIYRKAFVGGQVLADRGELASYTLLLEDDRIGSLLPWDAPLPSDTEIVDVTGGIVAPGFIDTHVHGAMGCNFMNVTPETFPAISGYMVRGGVTSCLATTTSALLPAVQHAMECVANLVRNPVSGQLQVVGIHLEGPFINPEFRGSHTKEYIRPPKLTELQEIYQAAGETLRVVTLAPEVLGGLEAIRFFAERGV